MTYSPPSMDVHPRAEHIRPYQVLQISDSFGEEVRFFMPDPQARGSLTTIESMLLLKLMRIVNPEKVFEFGTFKGQTTRLLLDNLSESENESERVFTLDLPELDGIKFQGADFAVASQSINFQRKYLLSSRKHWVRQLLQDSMTFDGGQYENQFQFIFIDGNHELSYARRDTENAFKMLASPCACIVWHDYGNPDFPELTRYIDELSQKMKVYRIEDTMLAFHLLGREVPPRRA